MGRVPECHRSANEHENTLCQLCDHCASVQFPICQQCRHGRLPKPAPVAAKPVPKGRRGFY